jgi:hypothetical protein
LRKLEISGIFLRFRAWPDGRLHAQICEFIFARTLSRSPAGFRLQQVLP